MSWADKVKATALATAAEHTATPARNVADASYTWNAYDVWQSRVQPPRTQVELTSMSEPPTPPPQATAGHRTARLNSAFVQPTVRWRTNLSSPSRPPYSWPNKL